MTSTNTETGGAPRRRRSPNGEVYPQFRPKNPVTEALGKLLRDTRERAGISIKEMKDMLGCSTNAYRMHESGASAMRTDTLLKAAKHLGIKPEELLSIDPHLLDE